MLMPTFTQAFSFHVVRWEGALEILQQDMVSRCAAEPYDDTYTQACYCRFYDQDLE